MKAKENKENVQEVNKKVAMGLVAVMFTLLLTFCVSIYTLMNL